MPYLVSQMGHKLFLFMKLMVNLELSYLIV